MAGLGRNLHNGDGTITDNLTGLMWLKDGDCFGNKTWQDALDTVADFNANPGNYSCGGGYTATYDDWVLPNVNEFESLINAEEPNPATWLNGQGFVNVLWDHHWSSTTGANDSNYAWAVCMYDGLVTNRNKSGYYSVWAVRATTTPPAQIWQTGQTTSYATGDDGDLQRGVAWPAPRFKENGDGTVTDNLTGLMWLKDANCFMNWQKWQEGLDKVVDFNTNPGSYTCGGYTGTYDDWRLPNRKELYSLTDFSQYNPALPAGHPFLNVQRHNYWSSTTYAINTGYSWIVYMGSGHVCCQSKSNLGYMWPVRGGQGESFVDLDIKANGQDGPIVISPTDQVSIEVSLDPGDKVGQNADWWIVAQWPFGMFKQYYSYVYPDGWLPGISRCIEMPLVDLAPTNVLTTTLPPAEYEFFFLIDDNADGIPDGTWVDSVKVTVR